MNATRDNSNAEKSRILLAELSASIAVTPIATVITDNQVADNPIVKANAAFCELTGYSEHEILGRNCRFLAGPGSQPSSKRALRDAVIAGTPSLAVLTNYRKNGSPFLNAVMIAPVLDADGKVAYFIGSQMVVGPLKSTSHYEASADRVRPLTPRQRAVLRYMVIGHRNRQIAKLLGIEERTVKMHRAGLLQKLGVRTSGDAIRIGVEARLHQSEE